MKHQVDELVLAARMYWEQGATQDRIAGDLGVSRPTVSRLLREAREQGIVQISVVPPRDAADADLETELAEVLSLDAVYLAGRGSGLGPSFLDTAARALLALELKPEDIVAVSSGKTTYEIATRARLPVPGLTVVPYVAGQREPQIWHQTNEIVRALADSSGGEPHFLWAEAMPSPGVHRALLEDEAFLRIAELWARADASLLGIGPPTFTRSDISHYVPVSDPQLRSAVGDICLHFYDLAGTELRFDGDERLVRAPLEDLRRVPRSLAFATGPHKALSVLAGAKLGVFRRLVSDVPTAEAILAAAGRGA